MKKVYDMAVKTGTYTDKEGKEKGRYLNVGAVLDDGNGPFLLLDRTFNPAGLPNPDNRSNVIISLFKPKDAGSKPEPQQTGGGGAAFEDSETIPF